jgi:hypothetical protein
MCNTENANYMAQILSNFLYHTTSSANQSSSTISTDAS